MFAKIQSSFNLCSSFCYSLVPVGCEITLISPCIFTFTVNVQLVPDDPELWDLPLEAADLNVTNRNTAAMPAQHPGTPLGQYHMMTRSKTPQRINHPRTYAKPETFAAHRNYLPGSCYVPNRGKQSKVEVF